MRPEAHDKEDVRHDEATLSRRRWLQGLAVLGLAGTGWAAAPQARIVAAQLQSFLAGAPVPDIQPEQLSPHVWMVYATEGFPTE